MVDANFFPAFFAERPNIGANFFAIRKTFRFARESRGLFIR